MNTASIYRGVYRDLRQSALLPFAQNCCERTLENPAYPDVQDEARRLREKCTAYAVALAAAVSRGVDTVAAKNQARLALLDALDTLAERLEKTANGDPLYFTAAGFSPRSATIRRFSGVPAVPDNFRVSPGAQSGEALLRFEKVPGARMYAAEWSEGPDQPWQNGNYTTARQLSIPVTARREIWVRIRAIGTANRRGPWTAPVMAFIP